MPLRPFFDCSFVLVVIQRELCISHDERIIAAVDRLASYVEPRIRIVVRVNVQMFDIAEAGEVHRITELDW